MDRTRGYWWAPDGSADPDRARRRDAGPVLAHRRSGEPEQARQRGPLSGGRDCQRRRYGLRRTPGRQPDAGQLGQPGTALPGHSQLGRDRPAAGGGEPRPAGHAHCAGRSGHRPDQPGASRDTDPSWVDIVRGVPASTADGRIVWTADIDGAKRLVAGTAAEHADGSAPEILTPTTLNLVEVQGSRRRHDPVRRLRRWRCRLHSVWTAGPGRPEPGQPGRGDAQRPTGRRHAAADQPAASTGAGRRSPCCGPTSDCTSAAVARIGSGAEAPDLPRPGRC